MNLGSLVRYVPKPLKPWAARFADSPTAQRLAGGTLWSTIGAVVSRLAALVAAFVVARMVGTEGFGEYGTVQGTIGMLGVFAGLGLGMTSTKYVAEFLPTDKQRVGRVIGLSSMLSWGCGSAGGLFLLGAAPLLAVRVLNAAGITVLLWVAVPYLICATVNGAQLGVLSGFQAFQTIAWVNIASGVCTLAGTVAGAKLYGTLGAVGGLSLSQILITVLYFFAVRREARLRSVPLGYQGCWAERHILWRFSAPALLSNIVVSPVLWLCNSIMVNQPGGYAEAGIYNAANQWRLAILFLPTTLNSVTLPMLAGLYGANDRRGYRRMLGVGLAISVAVALAISVPIVLWAGPIMGGYGAGFASGTKVLYLLALASVLMAGLNVVGQAIACEGRMWNGALLNLLWGLALVGCYYPLRQYGAIGLGLANLVAYLFHLVLALLYVHMVTRRT